ncbi:hypothetical protein [Clostridium sp. AM58-1XD]|uniref:hypothetical protein n=1 Tax=Clostridium sp. AM58-1XD TaxID=2292307 RepID=UPI000E4B9569|nr:hypothetical protein [Clostridium sp. AM58-1XD]RGY99674.1 hypothetical protein DXA13_07520 [Clostridium sp. AM58-1XD]
MNPEIIIMLTNNDITVSDAEAVFDSCKDLPVKKWGFKDVGLEKEKMKALAEKMKGAGKETYLEVVTYTEEGCLEGAKLADECGFDYLTGTLPFDSVFEFAKAHDLKYYPFVGNVGGSPVALTGTIDSVIESAKKAVASGADGVDLTAYRYTDGDPIELTKALVQAVGADKVCIAGSIGSEERMDLMKEIGVAEYTMGSALFNGNFVKGGTFRENLEFVLNYINH